MRRADVHHHGVSREFMVTLNVGANIGPELAHTLVRFFVLVLNLHSTSVGLKFTRNGHESYCLFSKQISDVNIYFSAHGAGLDLEPAGVAGDVPVPALHDGGQGDPRADRTLQVLLQIIRKNNRG